MIGVLVLIGTLVLAGVAGLVLRARSGRVRVAAARPVPDDVRQLLDPDAAVTLVHLSTAFCAPCRQVRVLLADLADRTAGLHHAELDLTERPDLARELSVLAPSSSGWAGCPGATSCSTRSARTCRADPTWWKAVPAGDTRR